jgi:hypothetical protein
MVRMTLTKARVKEVPANMPRSDMPFYLQKAAALRRYTSALAHLQRARKRLAGAEAIMKQLRLPLQK